MGLGTGPSQGEKGEPGIVGQGRLSERDPRVAKPLYTLREAARYLDLPVSTLRHWAKPEDGAPLITLLAAAGHAPSLPFIGFAEAFVLQAARNAGVPKWRIRHNVAALRDAYGSIDHLLASQRVSTDGAEILVKVDDDENLEVPRLKQRQLTQTVRNQLQLITYAGDGYAQRLVLPRYEDVEVEVDPLIAAGSPVVHGTRVKDVTDRYNGGDSTKQIAKAFGLKVREVDAVLAGNA